MPPTVPIEKACASNVGGQISSIALRCREPDLDITDITGKSPTSDPVRVEGGVSASTILRERSHSHRRDPTKRSLFDGVGMPLLLLLRFSSGKTQAPII